jgi:hypothetical protein
MQFVGSPESDGPIEVGELSEAKRQALKARLKREREMGYEGMFGRVTGPDEMKMPFLGPPSHRPQASLLPPSLTGAASLRQPALSGLYAVSRVRERLAP